MSNDINDLSVIKEGSLTIVSKNTEADERESIHPENGPEKYLQDVGGTVEITSSGKVIDRSVTTYDGSGLSSGLPGEIMGTLQTLAGGAVSDTSNIDPDKVTVAIDGVRTTLSTAMRLGYVNRQGDQYVDAQAKEAPVKPQKQAKQSEPMLHQNAQNAVNAVKAKIGKEYTDSIMARAISDVVNEKDASATIKEFSSALKIEEDDGYAVANEIVIGIQGTVIESVERLHPDIDGNDLADWCATRLHPTLRASLLLRAYHGDRSVIEELAQRFRNNQPV